MLRRVLVLTFVLSLALAASVGILGEVRAQGAASAKIDYTKIAPPDLVKNTPKGKLVNPYKDSQASIVAEGTELFRSYSCSGCHGGNGGGGICPPLTNGMI
jgi:mono/diheme cytochrome c family protein